ncbi:MAG TPA: protein phosphatase 2C domain-containing protein [Ktedonobacteraceae bacterium]|jgi:serine/threonine protein phosphatase PrpC
MVQKTSGLAYSEQAGRSTLLPDRQMDRGGLFASARNSLAASLARPEPLPGELLDLDHQTISLRTQLRLCYETYAWLRYLTWTGLALAGVLLLILPGGFPSRAFLQLWQTLPLLGRLVSLHGASALFSLALLAAQALTWFVLWGLWAFVCNSLARYTWHLQRAQNLLANAWLPSATREKPVNGAPTNTAGALPTAVAPGLPAAQVSRPAAPAPDQVRQFAQPSISLARPRTPPSPGEISFHWPSASGSASSAPGVAWDVGLKRRGRPNEDSILTLRGTCNVAEKLLPFELHIVADGMGGHANGRLASHLAIRGMLETVVPGLVSCTNIEGEGVIDILIDGVHWANQVIYQYGQEQQTDLGTTITAVLLLGETAYIINVGDSRTYVYRPGAGLTQITRDHSLVARLVETGAISPDEVYTHPDRNKVYRGLGDKMDVTVDWFILPVQNGDLVLLCSDGLWEMVRDPQIAEILQAYASAPTLASNTLLRAALQAGGSDNVGLLVAKVQL